MLHRSTRLEISENQHHRDDIRAAGITLDISDQTPGGAAPHRYLERGYPTPVMLHRWVATAVVSRWRADTHRQCHAELGCRHELMQTLSRRRAAARRAAVAGAPSSRTVTRPRRDLASQG